jgi:hypothetical protein
MGCEYTLLRLTISDFLCLHYKVMSVRVVVVYVGCPGHWKVRALPFQLGGV